MKDDILAEHSHRDGGVFEGSPAQRRNARTSPHVLSFTTCPAPPLILHWEGEEGERPGLLLLLLDSPGEVEATGRHEEGLPGRGAP